MARISHVLFILQFPSFFMCHSKNFMRILLILSKYILQSRYKFSQDDHILRSSSIDPWACLHMLSRFAPLLGRIMYPLLKTSCSLFNVYLVCLSPPTVHTDYSAANAWRAVGGAEIRHDTWDRREDIPGKESFQDNLENKLETNPATILESHAVNVWWNYCVFALSP